MARKNVFITRPILNSGIEILQNHDFIVKFFQGTGPIDQETLYRETLWADALITMLNDSITREFLNKNAHLKIIANYAVGFNNIDLETANLLKIPITNTPDVLTEATAEIAFGLMIMTSRSFYSAHLDLMENKFTSFNPQGYLGHALKGKTLGIVGMGRIGSRLAEMAHNAFGMKIIFTSKNSTNKLGLKVALDELLKNADVVSIHTPLTADTKHLIAANELKLMKKNAILINTSRGEVIDQDALYDALINEKIFGAGLDVTSPEPLAISHPLKNLKNVFILPHIGSATYEARGEMSLLCAQNIIDIFAGKIPKTIINKQIFNL